MKIVVMVYSGAGKSTLAKRLGESYNAPVLHLDKVQFLPNWEERELSEKIQLVGDFMNSHGSWVIDGNYSKLFRKERLEQADKIILLLFNRFTCLKRVISRYKKYKGKTRPDMGENCNEKIDLEFIKWVLRGGRTKAKKADYKAVIEKYREKITVLKNQRELDDFLRRLKK